MIDNGFHKNETASGLKSGPMDQATQSFQEIIKRLEYMTDLVNETRERNYGAWPSEVSQGRSDGRNAPESRSTAARLHDSQMAAIYAVECLESALNGFIQQVG